MPQLQSLHLHVQAPVLTEPGLDSPLSVWTPVLFAPYTQWLVSPLLLGGEDVPPVPWNFVFFALPFPEHLTSGKNCWI